MIKVAHTVFGPEAKAIITSPQFGAFPMDAVYRQLQEKTGIDLSACIEFIRLLPIFHDGAEHKVSRRRMAGRLSSTQADQKSAIDVHLPALLDNLFQSEGDFDLVSEFARPLWTKLEAAIFPAGGEALTRLSYQLPFLFNPDYPLRRRKQINDQLAAVIQARGEEVLHDLALLALGVRPFCGSIALSIYALSEMDDGKFDRLPRGPGYSVSAVRYIDRVALEEVTIAGKAYVPGERLRCYIQHEEHSDAANRDGIYGFGAHACIGRAISQHAYTTLHEHKSKYPYQLTAVRIRRHRHGEPFLLPDFAIVQVRR